MKEKISEGANDRPKNETIAQSGAGLPDDSGPIIDVDTDGAATVRAEEDGQSKRRNNADEGGRDGPNTDEIASAGAEEDTYD
jgi:hypothetical protein